MMCSFFLWERVPIYFLKCSLFSVRYSIFFKSGGHFDIWCTLFPAVGWEREEEADFKENTFLCT